MPVLLIFARAPLAGRCKTRLIPKLGARGAAWVQKRLVEHACAAGVQALGAASVRIYAAPDAGHPHFSALQQRFEVPVQRQLRGDLGQKMRAAIHQSLACGPVLLMGSDAFGVTAVTLGRTAQALQTHDYAIVPAPDGGYGLIAARKRLPRLAGIAWSSGREYAQTVQRLTAHGSVAVITPACADFDTAADWRQARQQGRLKPLIR